MSNKARCSKCNKSFSLYVKKGKAYIRSHTRPTKDTVEVCPGSGKEV